MNELVKFHKNYSFIILKIKIYWWEKIIFRFYSYFNFCLYL